jgi:hypothetical protein
MITISPPHIGQAQKLEAAVSEGAASEGAAGHR